MARFDRRDFLAMGLGTLALGGSNGPRTLAEDNAAVPGVQDRILKLAADAPLTMQFIGQTADECRLWQRQFSAKLRELLGPFAPPERWQAVTERSVDCGDHERKEMVLTAEGIDPVPMHLLLPKRVSGSRPGILALHGHGAFGHDPVAGVDDRPELRQAIESANYDYGRQLVRRGYVVAAPCFTPFGRRRGDKGSSDLCGVTATRLQFLGRLLMAENLRDALWSLEAMLRHAPVDPDRLGCVGLSYGGRMTTLTAAIEPRMRVAVVSGALNCYQERIETAYGAGCQLIPGLLKYGDIPEIASLIAPRPCLWETGSRDGLIKPAWVETAWKRMSRAYRALGAIEQLQIDRFEGGHRWNGVAAAGLLDRVLVP